MPGEDVAIDAELVGRARSGDSAAFDALVARHEGRVRRVARAWSASEADADDLAQTAFLRAFRDLGQLDDPARFGRWVLRIVLNAARDARRRATLRPFWSARSLDAADLEGEGRPLPPSVTAPDADPADTAAAAETAAALDEAIANLPPDLRTVLVLHIGEGLPHAAIAETVGCTEATVRWRLFEARKILRTKLGKRLES